MVQPTKQTIFTSSTTSSTTNFILSAATKTGSGTEFPILSCAHHCPPCLECGDAATPTRTCTLILNSTTLTLDAIFDFQFTHTLQKRPDTGVGHAAVTCKAGKLRVALGLVIITGGGSRTVLPLTASTITFRANDVVIVIVATVARERHAAVAVAAVVVLEDRVCCKSLRGGPRPLGLREGNRAGPVPVSVPVPVPVSVPVPTFCKPPTSDHVCGAGAARYCPRDRAAHSGHALRHALRGGTIGEGARHTDAHATRHLDGILVGAEEDKLPRLWLCCKAGIGVRTSD
jgi:hypothetical protein